MVDSRHLIENAYLVAHLLRYEIHPHGDIAGGEIQRFASVKVVALRRLRFPSPHRPAGPEHMQQRLVVEENDVPKVGSLGIANDLLPRDISPEGDPTLDDHLPRSTGLSKCLGEGWTFSQEIISPGKSIGHLGCRFRGHGPISCRWVRSDGYIILVYRTILGFGLLVRFARPDNRLECLPHFL